MYYMYMYKLQVNFFWKGKPYFNSYKLEVQQIKHYNFKSNKLNSKNNAILLK